MSDVTMCDHLIEDGHLRQPFALLATGDGAAYLCPSCLAGEVERRIDTQQPTDLGDSIHFDKCGHVEDKHCRICEVAGTSAIALRHSYLRFSGPATANRVGKVLRVLGQKYNRCAVRAIDPGQETEAKPVHSARLLRSESLNGDRARAASKWQDLRKQRLRVHKVPVQSVRVIPPRYEAAVA
jgi:hypothetical protein